ncbi:glycosyltransferase 61 family protein [Sandaracinus amylolyticus]|uniref:Glycosyltransferase 61 catalytic domain-containing protein n=1 Tax=Sandaracinus amylolyticus TaxID=927083 RepID=A0A0F6WAM2_9BACT|nr:glycosyltransferase family 61 protein [Sandaracinus amylolyticus]AKF11627.1 hypothetical protein DB32_008776 [Sandaracinus amylolyticus]
MIGKWTPLPALHGAARLFGWKGSPLQDVADRTWTLSPARRARHPRAFFLPNQLERVRHTMFSEGDAREEVEGGVVDHAPTRAFLFQNAWLLDGVLYKGRGHECVRARTRRIPPLRVQHELARGAVYSTFAGMQYFGNWLLHDCLSYPLAAAEGEPVTISRKTVGCHEPTYEEWLGMKPSRLDAVFFRELVLFDDFGYTEHKRARFRALREKLFARVDVKPHPGVFVVRGRTGQGKPRVLENEAALAEMLAQRRGFRVLDPARTDVATIVKTCAGARVVVGVEGSGLAHGILGLAPGGSLLVLQPPDRFVTVYKNTVEREDQHFAFVVGHPRGDDFYVDPAEVERTLDMLPPARV